MTQIPTLDLSASSAAKAPNASASAKSQGDFAASMQAADRAPARKSEGTASSQRKAPSAPGAREASPQRKAPQDASAKSPSSSAERANAPKADAQPTQGATAAQPTQGATAAQGEQALNGVSAEAPDDMATPVLDEATLALLPVDEAAQAAEAANAALMAALAFQAPVVQSPQATAQANAQANAEALVQAVSPEGAAPAAANTTKLPEGALTAAPAAVPAEEPPVAALPAATSASAPAAPAPAATAQAPVVATPPAVSALSSAMLALQNAQAVSAPSEAPAPNAQVPAPAVPVVGVKLGHEGEVPLQASLERLLTNFTPTEIPKDASGSTTLVTTLDDAVGIETLSPSALGGKGETDGEPTGEGEADASAQAAAPGPLGLAGKSVEGAKFQLASAAAAPRAEDVLPQILKQAELLKANQANSVKLQLYPEHLGKMEIKVSVRDGLVSAQLFAHSHEVKGMLETQVASLQRSFAELGLKVDKVEVALASSQLANDFGGATGQMMQDPGRGRQQDAGTGLERNLTYEPWLEPEADEAAAEALAGSGGSAIDAVA